MQSEENAQTQVRAERERAIRISFDEAGDRLGTVHVAYVVDEEGDFVRYQS